MYVKVSKTCMKIKNIDGVTHDFLIPEDPKPGRFYILPKIHKPGTPYRPIISSNGHPRENISQFLDHHLQPLAQSLSSYIRGTTDFLQKVKDIKTWCHFMYIGRQLIVHQHTTQRWYPGLFWGPWETRKENSPKWGVNSTPETHPYLQQLCI